ncbi:MAG: hypothetical protein LLG06_16000 [Desulfobacteraceae bacterium]|nr:hypothetical protein [Desulfobacteraceae bacterium]
MSHLKKALEKAKAERTILLGTRSEERAGDEQAGEIDDVFKYLHRRIDQTFELRNAQVNGLLSRSGEPSPKDPEGVTEKTAPPASPAEIPSGLDAEKSAAVVENTTPLEADLEDALRDVTLDLEQDLKDVTLEDALDLERELQSALFETGGAPAERARDCPGEDAADSAERALDWHAKLLDALKITDAASGRDSACEAGADAMGAPGEKTAEEERDVCPERGETAVAGVILDRVDTAETFGAEIRAINPPCDEGSHGSEEIPEARGGPATADAMPALDIAGDSRSGPDDLRAIDLAAAAIELGEHLGEIEPDRASEPKPDMPADAIGYTRTRVVRIPEETFVKNKLVAALDDSPANEQFKLLRTQLFQYTRHRGLNTIQISGFGPGDGASLIALNLALSIAKDARQTTVLVDLNFRKPSIARLLGLDDGPGLRSHLIDGVPLEEIFISPGIRKLTVLLAGGTITNPTELLGSPKMESLVRELKERYDDRYVIFDTPGISECPDPLVISEYVDGLVLVARAHRTPQSSIRAAMNLLPKEKIFGMVLNNVEPDECD